MLACFQAFRGSAPSLQCHEFCNHEPSQCNYGACLRVAGDKADFLYSACADLKMLQLISSSLVPNNIRMVLSYACQKAKIIVVLVVCCSQRPLRQLPHVDVGNPPLRPPCGPRQVHAEEYSVLCGMFTSNREAVLNIT
jgi:hypothetical protein